MRKRVSRERTGINLKNTMIYWNADTNEVRLVDWPASRKDDGFCSWGACNTEISGGSFTFRRSMLFIHAYHMALEGVSPEKIHRALIPLDEYRDGIAEDLLWVESEC